MTQPCPHAPDEVLTIGHECRPEGYCQRCCRQCRTIEMIGAGLASVAIELGATPEMMDRAIADISEQRMKMLPAQPGTTFGPGWNDIEIARLKRG